MRSYTTADWKRERKREKGLEFEIAQTRDRFQLKEEVKMFAKREEELLFGPLLGLTDASAYYRGFLD
jgi:hypothetical protein